MKLSDVSVERPVFATVVSLLLVILVALFLGYKSAKSARKVTVEPINIGEITTGPTAGPVPSD